MHCVLPVLGICVRLVVARLRGPNQLECEIYGIRYMKLSEWNMFKLNSIRILILSIWWLKRYLNMLFKLLLLFYIYPSSWLDKSLLEKEALQKLLSRSRTHPGNSGKIGMWYDMERVKKTESKVDLCLDPPQSPHSLHTALKQANMHMDRSCPTQSHLSPGRHTTNVPSKGNEVWSSLSWPLIRTPPL